jgi:hypothetical protein
VFILPYGFFFSRKERTKVLTISSDRCLWPHGGSGVILAARVRRRGVIVRFHYINVALVSLVLSIPITETSDRKLSILARSTVADSSYWSQLLLTGLLTARVSFDYRSLVTFEPCIFY